MNEQRCFQTIPSTADAFKKIDIHDIYLKSTEKSIKEEHHRDSTNSVNNFSDDYFYMDNDQLTDRSETYMTHIKAKVKENVMETKVVDTKEVCSSKYCEYFISNQFNTLNGAVSSLNPNGATQQHCHCLLLLLVHWTTLTLAAWYTLRYFHQLCEQLFVWRERVAPKATTRTMQQTTETKNEDKNVLQRAKGQVGQVLLKQLQKQLLRQQNQLKQQKQKQHQLLQRLYAVHGRQLQSIKQNFACEMKRRTYN
ncbi:unnamed protein product [Ceratitis capitata]|uniref:(Mediterranean fruit fly) hypothetical protein n=1 Tax=Ceratitis capitata TaxID=7213 RepID=A0A811UDJ2_CERCA|nr:unnamed protein product [Ceratitis capitata]